MAFNHPEFQLAMSMVRGNEEAARTASVPSADCGAVCTSTQQNTHASSLDMRAAQYTAPHLSAQTGVEQVSAAPRRRRSARAA